MAIVRPTLSEIRELLLADAAARLPGVDVRLQRSIVEIVLLTQTAGLHGAYGYLQQLADDLFPDTAESEALDRHASLWGITRGPATYAQGWIGAPGTIPTTIPLGTRLRRSDGVEFERWMIGILADGSGVFTGDSTFSYSALGLAGTGWCVPVRAVRSGSAGNTALASPLAFLSPIAGVPPVPTVVLAISGAVDAESDDLLRDRVLARLQNPPQGGTAAEYKAWALGASVQAYPITRAWVRSPASGSNVVKVYAVNDGGAFPSAQPPTIDAQALTNIRTAIDARRPLSADRDVASPTFVAMGLTIALTPSTQAIKDAITKEIDVYLFDNHEPGQELPLSIIQAVVSRAASGGDARVTVPTANWTPSPSQLLYRGAITWV